MSLLQPIREAPELAFDREETLRLALLRHQLGDRAEAERLYLMVLEADPREPTVLYLYGMFNAEAGQLEAAERLLSRVVEVRPDNAEGHVALANLNYARGRRDQAISGFRTALTIQPGHPVALSSLAAVLQDKGVVDECDFDGAIDVCRASIALVADPAPVHALLGKLLFAAGRVEEAAEAYRASLALTPSPAAWAGLAMALLGAGDGEAALQAADDALAVDPGFEDGWFARGNALMAIHQPQAAVSAFERCEAIDCERARTQLALGKAYDELDRVNEARDHLARAVALDPASKGSHANLGSVLYRLGDLEAAARHCRLALELDPNVAVVHQNLAGILADLGEVEQARIHRDQAYGLCNLIVDRALRPRASVLVLTTSDSGNIPHKYLLPSGSYTRIDWFIEYARDDQAAELPPHDVVFNIIGDPDYAEATDAPVAEFLESCQWPVLNDPQRVARTRRDRLPALLDDIEGLALPRVVRLDAWDLAVRGLPASLAGAGLSAPALIRPIGSHGGKGLALVRSPQELERFDVGRAAGAYATEYVDFKSTSDGLYRKYRVIFVDRTPYPYHLAICNDWLVHYDTSQMPGDVLRQAEELRFLEDPHAALGDAAMTAVAAVGERLDLDYAGIDFSVLPDGRVLVFEANATMLVHPEAEGEFAYKNPYVERITSAFQAMVDRHGREANAARQWLAETATHTPD